MRRHLFSDGAARSAAAGAAALGLLVVPLLSTPAAALEIKPEIVQQRYRQVLTILSSGDEDEALEALFALETEALPERTGPIILERFWRLKLRVIRDLLQAGQLDQLVPIIVLHHDAFGMYRERERPLLAAHSRTMAKELAEILADRSEERESQVFAAWVLTSFGAYLQETRSVSASAQFFHRALEIAPGNGAALRGLAANHEKVGEYEEAIPYLEKSVTLDSRDHQSRLRLALCLGRTGRGEAARGHLGPLLQSDAPDWIRSLAFQELARQHEAAGEVEKSEAVLRRAVRELPDHQQPRVQLAALLELDRRPREARSVLAGVRANRSERDSPRYLYDQWPKQGIEEARETMRAMMEGRRDLLAAGLRAAPSAGVGS